MAEKKTLIFDGYSRRLDIYVCDELETFPRALVQRMIKDGKVTVNGKQVNIPSYLVKAGDTVEIKESCKGSDRYKSVLETTAGRLVPEWLESDQENLKGVVKELPTRDMIDVPVNEMLIVELYSK